ncbi:MAG: YbbR-like domain-containing protein, partial [Gemmataceae bacterium]
RAAERVRAGANALRCASRLTGKPMKVPMIDRMLSLVVALSLAFLVWLYARSRDQEMLDNVPVPVQVTLAPDQAEHYQVETAGPPHVMVSFTGSPPRIRELQGMLQHNELQIPLTFSVPAEHLHEARYNESLLVESSDVHTPPGVTAVMVEGRNRISLTLHRLVERRLPVRFEAVNDEASEQVVIEPATVLVRGPQEVLDRVRVIPTQPAEMPNRPSVGPASRRSVPLVQEVEGRPVQAMPSRVVVWRAAQARKIYDLQEVPVHFLCPRDFPLRPKFLGERAGRITLRVRGPAREERPRVFAFVDLTQGSFPAGRYHEPIQIQLPKDFELVQEPPRGVSFQLVPLDNVPHGLDGTTSIAP